MQSVVEDTLARISGVGGVEGYVIADEKVTVTVHSTGMIRPARPAIKVETDGI